MDPAELKKLIRRTAGTAIGQSVASKSAIKRVLVYARVSTKKQDMSIADQKVVLSAHIAEQKNWECIGILEEVERGSRRRKREQYQKLKQAIRDRAVDIVIVHEMSRLGRDFSELIRFLELADQNGVELHTMRGPVSYVAAVALALVADLQLNATSEQIKRAHLAINLDGLHIGTPPYGYRAAIVDGRKGHLTINEEEANIVRLIFKEYLAGKSPAAICRMLNRLGVPSPKNKKWRTAIITHKGYCGILHNVVYKGYVCYNMNEKVEDAENETVKHRIRPLEDWKMQRGKHVPLVEEADFDAAQERFANRRRFERTSTPGPLALFAGRIKCPVCMVVHPDGSASYGTMSFVGAYRNRQPRLRCSGVSIGRCENRRTYLRSEVYSAVLKALRAHLENPQVINAYLKEHAALAKDALKTSKKEMSRLNREVQSLIIERDNLVLAIAKGGDADLLNRAIAKANQDILNAKSILDRFLSRSIDFTVEQSSVDKYLALIDEMFERVQQSPTQASDRPLIEELNSLVDRIVVHGTQGGKGFELEIVGNLASIVTERIPSTGESSQRKNIVRSVTLSAEDAARNLKITFPQASSTGLVPFHKKVEDVLADDAEPVTIARICQRLADRGTIATWNEVDRAISYRREDFVNIRRTGFMRKSVYARLPLKWFRTTDAIIEAAETFVRFLSAPASVDQIRQAFRTAGFDIHGNGDHILLNCMKRSGRFEAANQHPLLWQLAPNTGSDKIQPQRE